MKEIKQEVRERRVKVNRETFIKAYVETQDLGRAYLLAGGEVKKKEDASRLGSRLLKNLTQDDTKKKTIIQLLKEKQRKILESITDEELEKAPINQKVISLGIMTDKLQLLENKPTSIMEIAPKMVFEGDKVSFKRLNEAEQKKLTVKEADEAVRV